MLRLVPPLAHNTADHTEFDSIAKDLIHELTYNADKYDSADGSWVTFYKVPASVTTEFRRAQRKCRAANPSINCIACASLGLGLSVLSREVDFVEISRLRNDILDRDDVTGSKVDDMLGMFSSFNVQPPATASYQRMNVMLPDKLRRWLSSASSRVGLSQSTLGIFAIIKCLADQDYVLSDHKTSFAAAYDSFLSALTCRLESIEAIVRSM